MLSNYLKQAFRILLRNPFFTCVNVLGLAVGFASFVILWQYSSAELQTDTHFPDHEEILRIGFKWDSNQGEQMTYLTFAVSQATIPPRLKNDFPEVESFVRILEQGGFFQTELHSGHSSRIVIGHDDSKANHEHFKETQVAYADRNMLEFFSIPMIHGDAKSALSGVNYVALSQSTAKKYFGNKNPLGEILTLNGSMTLKVNGVYKDMMPNSRLNYNMIISNEGLLHQWLNVKWGGTINFVKVRESSINDFVKKLNAGRKIYWDYIFKTCSACDVQPVVQPIHEITFTHGFIGDDVTLQKSRPLLLALGSIAIVVMIMAWVNYVNLSISRLTNRMKEFVTRNVNGASALDLNIQFLTESAVINIIAAGVALTLAQLLRGPLETYLNIRVADWSASAAPVWATLIIFVVAGTVVTGLYPAHICLRNQRDTRYRAKRPAHSKRFVTSMLTTFQFSAATILIVWSFVVYSQLNYILNKDTGFNRRGVVIIPGPVSIPPNYDQLLQSLHDRIKQIPHVNNAAFSRYFIGEQGNKPGEIRRAGVADPQGVESNAVQEDFIPLFGLKLLAGRNFVKDDRADVVIISRKAMKSLGYKNADDAIGTKVVVSTGNWNGTKEAEVIGVIEDYRRISYFNQAASNPGEEYGVFLMFKNKLFPDHTLETISLDVNLSQFDESIRLIREAYVEIFPDNAFEWRFLNDQLNQAYDYEKVTRNQILIFTLLAIGISCLGLIAMINQRIIEKTKEIGIRKILGAKSGQIGSLLIRTATTQVFIGSAIGIPVAYHLGQQYLHKYAERVQLDWRFYVIPMTILLIILFVSVSTMLWRAALKNPVDSLRYE